MYMRMNNRNRKSSPRRSKKRQSLKKKEELNPLRDSLKDAHSKKKEGALLNCQQIRFN